MNALKVKKRDGRYVKFNIKKIDNAILAAVNANNFSLSKEDIAKISLTVLQIIKQKNINEIDVEHIQDLVVSTLSKLKYYKLAQKYQAYRNERTKLREQKSQLMSVVSQIGIETDRDNANVGNNFSAKLLRIASEANK